jgi:hypothetical protein
MRALSLLALALAPVAFATALVACDQDYAASNAERHTFMGETKAAAPASVDVAPTVAASAPQWPDPSAVPHYSVPPAIVLDAAAGPDGSASAAPGAPPAPPPAHH